MKTDPKEILTTAASLTAGIVLYQLIFYLLKRWARSRKRVIPGLLNKHVYFPGLFLMIVITLWLTLLGLKREIRPVYFNYAYQGLWLCAIGATGLLLARLISLFSDISLLRLGKDQSGHYSVRKAKTKFSLIRRVLNFIIGTGTFAIMLMTFDSIRQVGGTILASAGVLGIIIGFAAQKSLGTLFAGIQIAVAQPIRIDDVVVVEKEFGVIGEITLTYVVVNTWDGRRLVLPINYFLEKGFENWTRSSPEIIAKVTVFADYSLPIEETRREFFKWLADSDLWDKRKAAFQVTNSDSKTIELRGIMSVRNSDDAWDIQCMMREKLITFIRSKYPFALPKVRVDLPPSVYDSAHPHPKKDLLHT